MTPPAGPRRLALPAALVGVSVVVAVEAGVPPGLVLEVVALLGGCLLALSAVGRLPVGRPPVPARRDRAAPVDELGATASHLAAAGTSPVDAWVHLRPRLRPLVRHRCERHGVDPTDPAAVRALVGDAAAGVAGPDVRRPTDRRGAGLGPAEIADILARLEQL